MRAYSANKIFTAHRNIPIILKVSIVSNRFVFSSFTSLYNIDLSRSNGKLSNLQRSSEKGFALARDIFVPHETCCTRPFQFRDQFVPDWFVRLTFRISPRGDHEWPFGDSTPLPLLSSFAPFPLQPHPRIFRIRIGHAWLRVRCNAVTCGRPEKNYVN